MTSPKQHARSVADYITKNPIRELEAAADVSEVSDWDSTGAVRTAFEKELIALGTKGNSPDPVRLRDRLSQKGVFDSEFTEESGKQKPTMNDLSRICIRPN